MTPRVTLIDVRVQPDVVTMEEISSVGEKPEISASNVIAAPMTRQQSTVWHRSSSISLAYPFRKEMHPVWMTGHATSQCKVLSHGQ